MIAFCWVLFVVLILVGMPVAFALGGSSVLMLIIGDTNTNMAIVQKMAVGVDNFTLLAIPFFMMAGSLMNNIGIGDRIFDFADTCVRHLSGGMGQVNVLASCITAGMSGTAVNDIASIGPIEVRAMEKVGFDRPFAGAVTAASSSVGPIIPPSVPMVLIGSIMSVSVSRLFIGGMIPGIIVAGLFMVYIAFVAKKRGYPKSPAASWGERGKAFWRALPGFGEFVILMWGFLSGTATPTEAASLAVAYALLLGFVFFRNLSLKTFWRLLKETALLCVTTMYIITAAAAFGLVITQQQIPQKLSSALFAMSDNYYVLVLMMLLVFLILGCLLESNAVMIIMTPIMMVVANQIGMSLIAFGVLEALVVTTGLYTPPVGVGMFLTCKVCHIKTESFLKEIWPFIICLIGASVLIGFFPQIITFLPDLLMG